MEMKHLKKAFEAKYGVSAEPMQCFFAPGRVNLIGEHIDYNGGVVFPAALSLGVYGILRFSSDKVIKLTSLNAKSKVSVDLKEPIIYRDEDGWGNYPKGIIKFLLDYGHSIRGCEILFYGDLPDGAGLSSSAAILVLTAFMLRHVNGGHAIDCVNLAKVCQKVENEFINVNCGIMDQFAVAMGRKDCAILLDCENLSYKYIPFVLGNYRLVIMNTNKKRELAESKYNQRRDECEQALNLVRKHHPAANLCQVSLADSQAYIKDPVLYRRAQHVITENQRVLLATELLTRGDLLGFGRLMTQSHGSLKDDYEVTGLELDTIVDCALNAAGCIGARMTGAGFGGCAIALVEMEKLEEFELAVQQGYYKITGLTPDFYVASIADGVKKIE